MPLDAVYYINLDRTPNVRWEHFKQYLPMLSSYNFIRFSGRDVSASPLTSDEKKLLEHANWDINLAKGVTGAALSHYNIWKEQIEKGHEWVLILEDDVEFTDPINFYQDIFRIFEDLSDDPLAIIIGKHGSWDNSFTSRTMNNTNLAEYNPHANPCCHAYIVSLECARLLVDASFTGATDHHINQLLCKYDKFIGSKKNMVIQKEELFGK